MVTVIPRMTKLRADRLWGRNFMKKCPVRGSFETETHRFQPGVVQWRVGLEAERLFKGNDKQSVLIPLSCSRVCKTGQGQAVLPQSLTASFVVGLFGGTDLPRALEIFAAGSFRVRLNTICRGRNLNPPEYGFWERASGEARNDTRQHVVPHEAQRSRCFSRQSGPGHHAGVKGVDRHASGQPAGQFVAKVNVG